MGAAVTVAESDNNPEEDESEDGNEKGDSAGGTGASGLSVRRVMVEGFEDCRLWRAVVGTVAEQQQIVEGMKTGLLAAAR